MQKSYSIELMRFIFMLVIAIWHCPIINIFNHGYLPVDFYFILSGYLIYNSFSRHRQSTCVYTINKLKKFYLEYILAFFLILSFQYKKIESVEYLIGRIPEIMLLQNIGIFKDGGINLPLWYMSVLIIGGGLLYSMLNNLNHISVRIIFPLYILLFYTLNFNENLSIQNWSTNYCVYMPLFRGMADMALGIIISYLYQIKILEPFCRSYIGNIIVLISLVLFFYIMFPQDILDRYVLLFAPLVIIGCMDSKMWLYKALNIKTFDILGGLSYTILVIHYPVTILFSRLYTSDNKTLGICIYILFITIVAFCFKWICKKAQVFLFEFKLIN